ncbi:hypothetical protein ACFE04_017566 [Oxalis oulophora]
MRQLGTYPNQFTFSAIIPTCVIVQFGCEMMQALIFKHGFHSDVYVGTALVDVYAKCGNVEAAVKVFDEMVERNIVTWNSMIVGFLHNKFYDSVVSFFRELVVDFRPDQVSFSSVLSTCANMGGLEFGRGVHGMIVKYGLVNLTYVRNSLMDMYFKCRMFDDAILLFETVDGNNDVVSWNVMMMGCIYNERFEEVINNFRAMRRKSLSLDEVSYSTALNASACLAALNQGTLIHNQAIKTGFVENLCVASSLITMYAKSGSLDDTYQVFQETENNRNVVCWSAMIAACQQHGRVNQAIEFFEAMLRDGIKPDYITFVSVISACNHAGRVTEGYEYFNSMKNVHGINPGREHYACMVDLLGRAGRLGEATKFIESMPIKPDSSIWGSLLGACVNHGNLEMGIEISERLFELEPDNPGNYVLLSNLYSRYGKIDEADKVRQMMGINRVRKEPGCSWIDIKSKTFTFRVHDKSHSRTDEIYEMLRKIEESVKKKGYVAETQFAFNWEGDHHKERSLWHHSEKLALAFGLLTLPDGAPIRIKKNLRTCGDCHTVMKFASEIFDREIIVRDINRFHHFKNGLCSCGDYW